MWQKNTFILEGNHILYQLYETKNTSKKHRDQFDPDVLHVDYNYSKTDTYLSAGSGPWYFVWFSNI
jgi:hypothetical protein